MVWNRKTSHTSSTDSSRAGPTSEVVTAITGNVGPQKCNHFPSDKEALSGNTAHHPKIFVRAAISKSWARILPRGYISGHLKILGDYLDNTLIQKKVKQNLVGKSLGKIKNFVQDFVPIRTALRASLWKNN